MMYSSARLIQMSSFAEERVTALPSRAVTAGDGLGHEEMCLHLSRMTCTIDRDVRRRVVPEL